MKYVYFVSFAGVSGFGGFGYCELSLDAKITHFDQIKEIEIEIKSAKGINVSIINYKLLRVEKDVTTTRR